VAVDAPYEQAIPGERPPLVPGMFAEVELRGPVHPDCAVVPRHALRGAGMQYSVCLVGEDGRLHTQSVEVEFATGGFAALRSGLHGGEVLILSDPTPAIDGMRVDAADDPLARQRLVDEATGASALR